jgi:D-alanyl-D-alanine carboxypeptidase (penicillin-binding protein 5/6)
MNYFYFPLTSLLFVFTVLNGDPLSVELKSQGAILLNSNNGAILYEKNSKEPFYPASITKIATAAFALAQKENSLNQLVTAEQESLASITVAAKKKAQYTLPSYWLETDGSHIGIKVGEQLSLKDLLTGMLVCSGNDAANVVAQACDSNIANFSKNMNLYLKKIGCENTHFVNPHGLHHPDHVTTAYDMAILCKEALQYPFFRETVAKTFFVRPQTNKHPEAKLAQTNRLLKQGSLYYPKAIGVKTGYTSTAQSTLVAAAENNGRVLIAVLLKCKEREDVFKDAIKLFSAAFQESQMTKIFLDAGPLSLSIPLEGTKNPLQIYTESPLALTTFPAEEPQLHALLSWEPVILPIQPSQKVGTLFLVDSGGKVHAQVDLLSQNQVSYSLIGWIKHFF